MRLAIDRSGRAIEDIGYVNYHGTSTVLNDAVESRCVRRLFGDRADQVPGSSTKSMIGHPQGASGAAGIWLAMPDTVEIVTVSPLATVSSGFSRASK